jgi:hypothetical protein
MSDKEDTGRLTLLGGGTAFAALIIVGIFMRAWIMADAWTWFVVPVWHMSPLSIAQCVGLQCFVAVTFPFRGATNDARVQRIAKKLDAEAAPKETLVWVTTLTLAGYPLLWCIARLTYALIGGGQ